MIRTFSTQCFINISGNRNRIESKIYFTFNYCEGNLQEINSTEFSVNYLKWKSFHNLFQWHRHQIVEFGAKRGDNTILLSPCESAWFYA